jgi:hypothetical protein
MAGIEGLDLDAVILDVKEAIRISRLLDQERKLDVARVDLVLKVAIDQSGGAELKLKIPFVDVELGPTGSLQNQESQTIKVSFKPVPPRPETRERNIVHPLVDGISAVRRSILAASGGEEPLGLQEGTVILDFVYTKKGGVSLGIFKGSAAQGWTNQVSLTLEPTAAPGG